MSHAKTRMRREDVKLKWGHSMCRLGRAQREKDEERGEKGRWATRTKEARKCRNEGGSCAFFFFWKKGESLVIICGIKKVKEMRITRKTQILFGRICGFTVMFIHRRKTRYTVHTLKWRTLCT